MELRGPARDQGLGGVALGFEVERAVAAHQCENSAVNVKANTAEHLAGCHMAKAGKQIGNAVPVAFGQILIQHIRKFLVEADANAGAPIRRSAKINELIVA